MVFACGGVFSRLPTAVSIRHVGLALATGVESLSVEEYVPCCSVLCRLEHSISPVPRGRAFNIHLSRALLASPDVSLLVTWVAYTTNAQVLHFKVAKVQRFVEPATLKFIYFFLLFFLQKSYSTASANLPCLKGFPLKK